VQRREQMKDQEIKKIVREGYARVAKRNSSCCVPQDSCCGGMDSAKEQSRKIGYEEEELQAVPEGANLGLGCGNPTALASLREGEVVLDLGSGAGLDCFLAANQVGKRGKVIGVDMTPEMVERSRENARKAGYENVEFRLGEIENLPVADRSVDVVISNCVINLSPNKRRVFQEAFRALRPGGRLFVSDIVLLRELPEPIKKSVEGYVACLAGAMMKGEYVEEIRAAGFQEVRVMDEKSFSIDCIDHDPAAQAIVQGLKIPRESLRQAANSFVSVNIYAIKPDGAS